MLKTFELCPKKFYLRYVKNISMPINDDVFELGKNIHAMASYYLRKEDLTRMEKSLDSKEKQIWEYLREINYFSYECINTEYSLSVRINNHFFGGRLDALVKDSETYYILDYKTGSAPKNARYDYQTMVYMLAVSSFFNTDNVKFVYLDLKNKCETVIELTPELKNEYKNKLCETIEKIEKQEFIKKTNNCDCEYKLICY